MAGSLVGAIVTTDQTRVAHMGCFLGDPYVCHMTLPMARKGEGPWPGHLAHTQESDGGHSKSRETRLIVSPGRWRNLIFIICYLFKEFLP